MFFGHSAKYGMDILNPMTDIQANNIKDIQLVQIKKGWAMEI